MPIELQLAADTTVARGWKWLGARRRKWPDLQREIADEARREPDPLLQKLIVVQGNDDRLYIGFHPAEEEAQFWPDDEDRLCFRARTNSAGPGYHAFLVRFLDRLAKRLDLQWRPQSAAALADSSGYFEHRDFGRLQTEMYSWLMNVAKSLLKMEKEGSHNFQLSWPLGAPSPCGSFFASSPIGEWDREFFLCLVEAKGADLRQRLESYFPWWGIEPDARFFANLGLVYARCKVPWHVPVNSHERGMYELMLDAYGRAAALDSNFPLPTKEIAEAREMAASTDRSRLPAADGLGVHRRQVRMTLVGNWTIDVPGYFYVSQEREGTIDVLSHGNRKIEITSLSANAKDGEPAPTEWLLESSTPLPQEHRKHEHAGHVGVAYVSPIDSNKGGGFRLHGRMAKPGNLAMVTITFADRADEAWAFETWRSVFHRGEM
ncbi:MAG: hypothetical protein ACREJ2_03520 [Planctomycetota bacterium]